MANEHDYKEDMTMPTTSKAKAPAKKPTSKTVFSKDELEAMQDAKKERRKGDANGESDVLAKIKEMKGSDREMAEKIHAIVKAHAPNLAPRTWYGMPAYAGASGNALCYFTPAARFKSRYATFGFNGDAKLDDGNMWPTSFALTEVGDAEEKRIAALIKKAAG
jgi:uncharacterized protein YdhG (YjbR/CyaY superfamily)